MTAARPTAPSPAFSGAVSLDRVLADQPPVLHVDVPLDEVQSGRRLVVLDDDPTGTQTIADIPVLTSWSVDDIRWALRQPTTAFFILTNTRSLTEADVSPGCDDELPNNLRKLPLVRWFRPDPVVMSPARMALTSAQYGLMSGGARTRAVVARRPACYRRWTGTGPTRDAHGAPV